MALGYLKYLAARSDPTENCHFVFKDPYTPYPIWEKEQFPWAPKNPDVFGVQLSCLSIFAKKFKQEYVKSIKILFNGAKVVIVSLKANNMPVLPKMGSSFSPENSRIWFSHH
jgi:hypothetical protein